MKLLKPNDFVICESNSLRYIIKPSIFLLIKMKDSDEMKPSAAELKKYADFIVLSDGEKHHFDINRLKISEKTRTWVLD